MPQSARLTEGGGGNRYLGNAPLNLETISGVLPLHTYILKALTYLPWQVCVGNHDRLFPGIVHSVWTEGWNGNNL